MPVRTNLLLAVLFLGHLPSFAGARGNDTLTYYVASFVNRERNKEPNWLQEERSERGWAHLTIALQESTELGGFWNTYEHINLPVTDKKQKRCHCPPKTIFQREDWFIVKAKDSATVARIAKAWSKKERVQLLETRELSSSERDYFWKVSFVHYFIQKRLTINTMLHYLLNPVGLH